MHQSVVVPLLAPLHFRALNLDFRFFPPSRKKALLCFSQPSFPRATNSMVHISYGAAEAGAPVQPRRSPSLALAFALIAAALVACVGIVSFAKTTNALAPVETFQMTKLGTEYMVSQMLRTSRSTHGQRCDAVRSGAVRTTESPTRSRSDIGCCDWLVATPSARGSPFALSSPHRTRQGSRPGACSCIGRAGSWDSDPEWPSARLWH